MSSADIRTGLHLIDFAPESISGDEHVVALLAAIDPEVMAVAGEAQRANVLPRISDLDVNDPIDVEIIAALAWQFRFHQLRVWDMAPLANRRDFLVGSLDFLSRSGTRWAVEQIAALTGWNIVFVEWQEEPSSADPGTYRVVIHGGAEVAFPAGARLAISEWCYRFAPTGTKIWGMNFVP